MANIRDAQFRRRIADRIAQAGIRRARIAMKTGIPPGFGSATLSKALRIVNESVVDAEIRNLYVPHYWAVYLHDGRSRPIRPRTAKFLVWYPDFRQDPRRPNGGYPERYAQVRRLTREEFIRDKAAGKLVFSEVVTKPVPPSPFFGNGPAQGMAGFLDEVRTIVPPAFSDHVKKRLGKWLNHKEEIVIRIG